MKTPEAVRGGHYASRKAAEGAGRTGSATGTAFDTTEDTAAATADGVMPVLSQTEFRYFQDMIYNIAGIAMSDAKQPLVSSRLMKRVRHYRLASFGDYFQLITSPDNKGELQTAVDLLTTNETYFFREPKHFEFLRDKILPEVKSGQTLRIWSAACSSGEESYSLAMLAQEHLGDGRWQIHSSDLSSRVLDSARTGIYPMSRASKLPTHYLHKYCLKGIGRQQGKIQVDPVLKKGMTFFQHNLQETRATDDQYDIIFLRNVMIYFDAPTKRKVVSHLLPKLRPGGYFIISHSESMNGISDALRLVQPAVYQKR
tara:strand:- start:105280 stop:106218 length:939 start_codon:yes stop_codon:yes gene_type:complete